MSSNRDRFQSYRLGWKTGAAGKLEDPKFTRHHDQGIVDAYSNGYYDGRFARRCAIERACQKYGYEPSILRDDQPRPTQEPKEKE